MSAVPSIRSAPVTGPDDDVVLSVSTLVVGVRLARGVGRLGQVLLQFLAAHLGGIVGTLLLVARACFLAVFVSRWTAGYPMSRLDSLLVWAAEHPA